MNYTNILYQAADGICTITINRPDKLNALNMETIEEVGKAVEAAEKDDNIKGIILTGAGEKAFVAGADIAEFANFSKEKGHNMSVRGQGVFQQIEDCSKPVLAAINGFTLGGGCELAMSCHMRVASAKAKFGQPEVNLGLIPGYGGTQRLVRLIGRTKATELLLTADMIGAEEARQLGLVNYVTEPENLMDKALEIMGKIITKSPLAIGRVLKLVNTHFDKKKDGFAAEADEFGASFETADFKEGVDAFLNKRKATFTGK